MDLGYTGKLYILAFDHRGSFKKKFGISGEATPEQAEQLSDAKHLVWEGVLEAIERGAPTDAVGVLVDEEMGSAVAREAKERGIKLAMPAEKSGQPVFDFEYGEAFGDHIEAFDPDFTKVLVRWNPADPAEEKATQGARLKQLGDWLHERGRTFLFELLVPASPGQKELAGGDTGMYDREARPYLTLEAIRQILDHGVEPDIWKIEGLDRMDSCRLLAGLIRSGGRDRVAAVVLGRGADDAAVDHWLAMGAPVPGYQGFAIGRSIWSAGVEGLNSGAMSRAEAVSSIAGNYLRFIEVYEKAAG